MPYASQLKILKISDFSNLVEMAIEEDQSLNDRTTKAIFSENSFSTARILCNSSGVLAGLNIVEYILQKLIKELTIKKYYQDGDSLEPESIILQFSGQTQGILIAERIALNFLSMLSGIASASKRMVQALAPYKVSLLDTRKTIPAYRILSKYAVTMGGGYNHRINLSEMGMIKDNHILAAGGVFPALKKFREKNPDLALQLEVDSSKQIHEALESIYVPEHFLLDNMDSKEMKKCTDKIIEYNSKNKTKITTEASGGFSLKNLNRLENTNVDFVSMSSITMNINPLDFSLEMLRE